jgi:hypothetical protein
MTGQIIDATNRFIKKATPAVDPLWPSVKALAADRFTKKPVPAVDPLVAWTETPLKTLPFVSTEWENEYWPKCMWVDVPTDNYPADRERGKHFAELTISAIDRRSDARALELIFEAIVNDAIRRRAKGGKGSRRLPGAVVGFIEGLAKFIVLQCQRGPGNAS